MKEMTIRELLILNILLEKKICTNLVDAISYDGTELDKTEKMADKAIQSFARGLNLLGGKGKSDLYMGATNVPYEKQSSLRLFKAQVSDSDIIDAIQRMYLVDTNQYGSTLNPTWIETDEECIRYFRFIRPWFEVLDIPVNNENILTAFHEWKCR